MTDLFDYKPAFGKTDTSREAAIKLMPHLPKMRALVYSAYDEPRTTSEAAEFLNIRSLSARPRTSELLRQGLIEDSGERRTNQWGNKEIVFRTL